MTATYDRTNYFQSNYYYCKSFSHSLTCAHYSRSSWIDECWKYVYEIFLLCTRRSKIRKKKKLNLNNLLIILFNYIFLIISAAHVNHVNFYIIFHFFFLLFLAFDYYRFVPLCCHFVNSLRLYIILFRYSLLAIHEPDLDAAVCGAVCVCVCFL